MKRLIGVAMSLAVLATAVWAFAPRPLPPFAATTLRPDEAGVALLIAHRKSLGLPGSHESYETIVDESLLPNSLQDNA